MFRTSGQHDLARSPAAEATEEHLSDTLHHTFGAGLVALAVWRFVALMRRNMGEMLMPRSSVRSMRTTSVRAGRSSEKLVKTQGVPGRNSAICCSVSVAFKCRAPLDMRRLPCHGPGLRKLGSGEIYVQFQSITVH